MSSEVELLRQKVKEVEIDSWIDAIKHYTPKTTIVPLDYKTGVALLRYFDEQHKTSKISMLTESDKQLVATLAQQLDHILETQYRSQVS